MVILLGQIMVVPRHLSKVTNCKLNKLIQPVLVHLAGCTLLSHHGRTFSSDNGGTGHHSKVTSSE